MKEDKRAPVPAALYRFFSLGTGCFFVFGVSQTEDDAGILHNHSACAGKPGLGRRSYQQAVSKGATLALLATMSYAKPQFETFSKEKKNPRDKLFVLLL